jgi:beta-lactamase class A
MSRSRTSIAWTCAAGALGLAPFGTVALSAQREGFEILRSKTEARLQQIVDHAPGALGLTAVDLTSGERFGFNQELVCAQGSAIKVPILMEVYKQAQQGKFELGERRTIAQQGMVGGSGVLQHFGAGSSALSVRDLCVLMIVLSDNSATNMLFDLVGMENVNRTLESLGTVRTRLRRKMMDSAASARGDENLSTPAEAVHILEILGRGDFINRQISEDILSILKLPKEGDLKAGIPAEVPLAFKAGSLPGVATEWAVVYLKDHAYAVAVMEGYLPAGDGQASKDFQEISSVLFEYFARRAFSNPYGVLTDPQSWK